MTDEETGSEDAADDTTDDADDADEADDVEDVDDAEDAEDADDADDDTDDEDGHVFSVYGIASTVLGIVAVAAIVLGALIFSNHRDHTDEKAYQARVLRTAVEWTGVLINMNSDNVEASLARLREGTVGQLNTDFDSAVASYPTVVRQLEARSAGQVTAVAIETVHQKPQSAAEATQAALPAELAARTDTVLVVATSVAENAGSDEQSAPVYWELRLDVSDVSGALKISRLRWIK